MPYAAEGLIGQDVIDGGVQITDERYLQLLDGMLGGQLVTIRNGQPRLVDPAPEPTPEPEPVDPNAPYKLFKSTFIRRMQDGSEPGTVDEAEIMEAVLAAAPARLRLLYNSVEYFISNDELFESLRAAVAAALSAERADELLAREF